MKKLSWVRASKAARRCAAACAAGETRHPARSGLSVKWEIKPEAVRQVPYTRLAGGQLGLYRNTWAADVFVSRRRNDTDGKSATSTR
jgi:hypothetical protein